MRTYKLPNPESFVVQSPSDDHSCHWKCPPVLRRSERVLNILLGVHHVCYVEKTRVESNGEGRIQNKQRE